MSESLTMNAPIGDSANDRNQSTKAWYTLLRKEFRETGYYGITIMICGLLAIVFGTAYCMVMGRDYDSILTVKSWIDLAKAYPLLMVIACGATIFAIEHENRSYSFLRALPVSHGLVFWTKVLFLILLTLASCLVFWPIAYILVPMFVSRENGLELGLAGYSFAMVEALLWALMFSLREKKVIHAIVKTGVGYFVAANGLTWFSALYRNDASLDSFFFWFILIFRIGIATILVVLIARSSRCWLRDADISAGKEKARRLIETDRKSFAPKWQRLAWLQWRANWFNLSFLGLASLVFVFASYEWVARWLSIGISVTYGSVLWSFSIAFLSLVAALSAGNRMRMLVAAGYRPRQIWLVHIAPVFLFCLLTALLYMAAELTITKVDKGDYPYLWFYVYLMLISFGAGQLASLFSRSLIIGMIAAGTLMVLFNFMFSLSQGTFHHQTPALVTLGILPIFLSALFSKAIGTTGKLGFKFWIAAPVLLGLSLIPLPLLRIYEVPDASEQSILAEQSDRNDFLSDAELAEVRKYGDELLRVQRRNQSKTTTTYELNQRSYLSVKRPDIEHVRIEKGLLASSADQIWDLKRLTAIRSIPGMAHTEIQRQIQDDKVKYSDVNRAVSTYGAQNEYVIYWWANHPKTTKQDILSLIRKLENEQEVFDLLRLYVVGSYHYQMAATTTDPDRYPELIDRPFLPRNLVLRIPWEVERFRRNTRASHLKSLQIINEMEGIQNERSYAFGARSRVFGSPTDIVTFQYLNVMHFMSLEYHLLQRRAIRLYLAIILWQRDHDGNVPSDLKELEGEYLAKLPINPFDGEPFYLAPEGFPEEKFSKYHDHLFKIVNRWEWLRKFLKDSKLTPAGHPILWINRPFSGNKPVNVSIEKIRSIEEFDDTSFVSDLEIWILPKKEPKP